MKYLKLALIFIAFISLIIGTIKISSIIKNNGGGREDVITDDGPVQVECQRLRQEWENKGWDKERFNEDLARIDRRSQQERYGNRADEVKETLYQLACTEAAKDMNEKLSREVVPDEDLKAMDETIKILFDESPGYKSQFEDEFELYYLYKELWSFIKKEISPCYEYIDSIKKELKTPEIVVNDNDQSIDWVNYAYKIQDISDRITGYQNNSLYKTKVNSTYVKGNFEKMSSKNQKRLSRIYYEASAEELIDEFKKREKYQENGENDKATGLLSDVRNRIAREYGRDVKSLEEYWDYWYSRYSNM